MQYKINSYHHISKANKRKYEKKKYNNFRHDERKVSLVQLFLVITYSFSVAPA
jgi:hypothetical protein